MVRLTSPSAWGTARDPETDERVRLDEDVDREVAERLADRYDLIEIEDDNQDEDDGDQDEDVDDRAVELADESYQDVVAAIEAGDADEFLDDLEEADNRVSVQDAVEARRVALEDEGEETEE